MNQRAKVFYVFLPMVAAVLGVALGLVADRASVQWQAPDWIALLYGIGVTIGGFYLAGYLGSESQKLQTAMSDLELREKVGVIESHALRSTDGAADPLWALYVASDTRAALHLYGSAGVEQQRDLLEVVARAYRGMMRSAVSARLSDDAKLCVREGTEALIQDLQEIGGEDAVDAANAFLASLASPPMPTGMFAQFRQLFEHTVQTQLDWELLAERHTSVESLVVTAPHQFDRWFTPWYLGPAGELDFRSRTQPLRLGRVNQDLERLHPSRQTRVTALSRQLDRDCAPLLVAVYVAGQHRLVLDGNHRLAAHLMASEGPPILALEVHGPVDADLLPDLTNLPPQAPA